MTNKTENTNTEIDTSEVSKTPFMDMVHSKDYVNLKDSIESMVVDKINARVEVAKKDLIAKVTEQ